MSRQDGEAVAVEEGGVGGGHGWISCSIWRMASAVVVRDLPVARGAAVVERAALSRNWLRSWRGGRGGRGRLVGGLSWKVVGR